MNAVSGVECVMRDGVETYPGAKIVVNQPVPEGKTRVTIELYAVSPKDDAILRGFWMREDEFDARYRAAETDEAREAIADEMSDWYQELVDRGYTVHSDDGLKHGLFSYATGETGYDEAFDCPITYVEYVPARMIGDEG